MPYALAPLWAVCVWCLLGAGQQERDHWKGFLARVWRRCADLGEPVVARAHEIAERIARRGRNDAHASLGEVSEMIDVVRLGLTAGLSFDAALELYCANRTTELARSLDAARIAWQVGMASREEELLRAAHAMDVRALEPFAVSVGQALALGAPLAETLAGQSREIKAARRAEVERQIERAPVKLLIPTGTLILPALLLSILGPLLAAGGML